MMMKKLIPAAAVLLIGLALTGCASDPSSPSAQLQQKIETARTPTDHEALAKYYGVEAASSRERASDHRKLAKTYQAVSGRAPHGTPTGLGGTASASAYHSALASQDENNATVYDGLATEHRNMAKAAKP